MSHYYEVSRVQESQLMRGNEASTKALDQRIKRIQAHYNQALLKNTEGDNSQILYRLQIDLSIALSEKNSHLRIPEIQTLISSNTALRYELQGLLNDNETGKRKWQTLLEEYNRLSDLPNQLFENQGLPFRIFKYIDSNYEDESYLINPKYSNDFNAYIQTYFNSDLERFNSIFAEYCRLIKQAEFQEKALFDQSDINEINKKELKDLALKLQISNDNINNNFATYQKNKSAKFNFVGPDEDKLEEVRRF